jgi:hypothetical protein
MERIRKYVDALDRIFRSTRDKHAANERSRAVLEEMSGDAAFLTEVLERHLRKPRVLDARHYPVVALEIEVNPAYTLVANCWIPLPGHESNVSTKSIHHHGDMLLSTVTSFGPGYEHWTFTKPELVDPDAELYEMRLLDRAPHPRNHVAFVDAWIAHLPFYPAGTSITYALWTSRFPVTWKDHVKRVPLLQKNSAALRSLAAKAGLAQQLELKVIEYFDFYPTADGFRGIRERTEFERGPNEDYLYSLFHIIQATGNEGLATLIEEQLRAARPPENHELVARLADDLRSGHPIEGRLSPTHYGIACANFTLDEVAGALAAQHAVAI